MELELPSLDFFENITKSRYLNLLHAIECELNITLDKEAVMESNIIATKEEMREFLLSAHVLAKQYAPEAVLSDLVPITPYTVNNIIDRFHDIEYSNRYIARLDNLTNLVCHNNKERTEYFTNTKLLIPEIYTLLDNFFNDSVVYCPQFEKFFLECIKNAFKICASYDNNDEPIYAKVAVLVKECVRDSLIRCDIERSGNYHKVFKGDFSEFRYAIYDIINKNEAMLKGLYTKWHKEFITPDNELAFEAMYDYINKLDIPHDEYALEAISENKALSKANEKSTKKGSGLMKSIKDGGYAGYKLYSRHAENYDNQANKLAGWMKKLVFGDKREQIIEGKTWTPMGIVKKMLGTVALFSVHPVAGVLGTLVLYATDKKMTYKERMQILTELENEQRMLQEKIEDAKSAGDNQAKYALMRADNELTDAIKKIRLATDRTNKQKATIKQALTRGSGTGA